MSESPADTFRRFLDAVGVTHHEYVTICWREGEGLAWKHATGAEAPAIVEAHRGTDVYWTVNEMAGPAGGRGTVRDVLRIRALYVDLDVKPGGVKDDDTAQAVIQRLSEHIHCQPAVTVNSGHGVHAYWLIEHHEDDVDHARALLKAFGALAKKVAARFGGSSDSVQDAARVLRAPGSWNHKQKQGIKVTFTAHDDVDGITDLDDLEGLLAEAGVPTFTEPLPTGEVLLSSKDWEFGTATCSYVTGMVSAWETATPVARHPWMLGCAHQLAGAYRQGCVTQDDFTSALATLRGRFLWLLRNTGTHREPMEREVQDIFEYSVDAVSRKSDDEVARELGNHRHHADHPLAKVTVKEFLRGAYGDILDSGPNLLVVSADVGERVGAFIASQKFEPDHTKVRTYLLSAIDRRDGDDDVKRALVDGLNAGYEGAGR